MERLGLIALLFCTVCVVSPASSDQEPPYYDDVDQSSPQALRDSLHQIIDDHTRFPYTSTAADTWDVLEIADENQDNSSQVITIYRNASYTKEGGGNAFYNREHTWPKSYGFPDDFSGNYPYTDMHHLFLADSSYNSSRSNKPYDNCDVGCIEKPTEPNNDKGGVGGEYPADSNWTDGSYTQGRWETWLDRRGDVARALMYMDVRYEGGVHGITGHAEPDLILTDDRLLMDQSNTGNNEAVGYMGLLSVLLQWHKDDPVDLIEMQHHEAVASFQGNRNPFIDHPEWVECVFEDSCPVFVMNPGLSDAWYEPATDGQGFFITVLPDLHRVALAWFTYDTELPPDDATATLGDPGHRWLTASGRFENNQATLNIVLTSGGIFDTPTEVQRTDPKGSDGTITLTFTDCATGTVEYDITSIGRTGTIPIQRVAGEKIAFCQALRNQGL